MASIWFPGRGRPGASLFAPSAQVARRQAWVAVLMGLIAVAPLNSLWSSSDLRPGVPSPAPPLPPVKHRLSP